MNIGDLRSLSEADRREGGIFRLGQIVACDYERAMVQVKIDQGITTDWLPWATCAAGFARIWSPPSKGEQCMVLSPSGEPGQAVAIPGVWCNQFPPPSADNETFLIMFGDDAFIKYEKKAGRMHLHAYDELKLTAEKKIVMQSSRIELN